jgi:nucleoid-associated protein YgaU
MFLKNSRYTGVETVTAEDRHGRAVQAVKRRPLPAIAGRAYVVQGPDKLDVIAEQKYKDGTRFWHVADANSELEANELTLVPGRVIQVPEK